jgi:hypothetical protein
LNPGQTDASSNHGRSYFEISPPEFGAIENEAEVVLAGAKVRTAPVGFGAEPLSLFVVKFHLN